VTAVAAAPLPLVVAGLLAGAAAALLSFAVLAVITLTAWMLDPSAAWDCINKSMIMADKSLFNVDD